MGIVANLDGMRWRVRVQVRGGGLDQHEVDGVAELRRLRERLLRDDRVVSWTWHQIHDPDPDEPAACPACHHLYESRGTSGYVTYETCQCGLIHAHLECLHGACWRVTVWPPPHEGCWPVPWDEQHVQDGLRKGPRKWYLVPGDSAASREGRTDP